MDFIPRMIYGAMERVYMMVYLRMLRSRITSVRSGGLSRNDKEEKETKYGHTICRSRQHVPNL